MKYKDKLRELINTSPLISGGAFLIWVSVRYILELGNDYTTIMYVSGAIILSIGLSILDNRVNGEIVYGVESKTDQGI